MLIAISITSCFVSFDGYPLIPKRSRASVANNLASIKRIPSSRVNVASIVVQVVVVDDIVCVLYLAFLIL